MLVSAAAAQWGVPGHRVRGPEPRGGAPRRADARLAFGALVPAAAKLPVPAARDAALQAEERVEVRRPGAAASTTCADITTGKAPFGLDIYRDNMVVASIEHPPVVGGSVKSVGDAEAREGARRARRDHAGPAEAAADVPVARRRGRDRRQHLGGAEGPARAEDRMERRRRTPAFESGAFQKQLVQTVSQPRQGGPQPRQRGRRVRQGRQGDRGHLLDADAGARVDGAAGRGGRLPERQGHGVDADAEPAGGAGNRGRGAGHRQEGRHLPRDAARRRLRPQEQARLRRRGGGAVEAAGPAGEGGVDARRRPEARLLPRGRRRVSQGGGGRPRQADGVAAPLGVPADRLHVRRQREVPAAASSWISA